MFVLCGRCTLVLTFLICHFYAWSSFLVFNNLNWPSWYKKEKVMIIFVQPSCIHATGCPTEGGECGWHPIALCQKPGKTNGNRQLFISYCIVREVQTPPGNICSQTSVISVSSNLLSMNHWVLLCLKLISWVSTASNSQFDYARSCLF